MPAAPPPEPVAVDRFLWWQHVRADPEVTGWQLTILLLVGTYLRADGSGFVSMATLADNLGKCERTVQRQVEWAMAAGYLVRTARGHRTGSGQARASEYQCSIPTASQPDTQMSGRAGAAPESLPDSTVSGRDGDRDSLPDISEVSTGHSEGSLPDTLGVRSTSLSTTSLIQRDAPADHVAEVEDDPLAGLIAETRRKLTSIKHSARTR